MSTTPTAPRRGTPRSPSHFTFDIAPASVAPHTSALSAMSAAMALPYAAGPSAAAVAAAADPAAFLVPQTTGRSYAEMEQIHAAAVEQAAREQWLLKENQYQQHQEQQQQQDQASRAAAFVRRFAEVFRDESQHEHDENEAAAAEEEYVHDDDGATHYMEHEQAQEHEQFAIEPCGQRAEAEADWAALNSSRPMPAPSAAELFEQQQQSWDELNAYHRQQQQEQEHEQQHNSDDYAHAGSDDAYATDDQHQHQPDQYHRHQQDEGADQFDEAHAAILELHQEREAHLEHRHPDENEHDVPSDAQHFPAAAQLHDDISRLAHRRRQHRTAAVEQHFTAAAGAWGAKRAARGGGARVHRSLQMAMDASTAVAGGGGGAASLLAMGGVRSSGGAGYSTSAAAAASASANLRGELLFDSDLEEDDDMGAEAFSFGLTSRIKAARTQFWDSVENISNHLTSLEIEDDTGSPQRPKRAPAAAATKRGQHQVLMHAILDEPAERLRHLLRLHQDALRAERELRISEAAVLLDANAYLKKLRRVEQLLALWHAAKAEARADADADGRGEDEDEEDVEEAEFCRAVEAVMSATDEGGAFKKTHGAQQRSFQ